ncbi:PTS system IIA component (Fru family) [Hypnocyclicus thermotrophus]|uniref:PTS system IIA component (Fru family) n=1 Tax=Hypnocyclicus thermotrophus TaxID=1627895 RepID=A0AA46DXW1_9FUSO|nr:PTS sugar transporter subunit IIA [Hypnocyclicus thermotrophus]TDT69147.1 PTS system IIA component (Fru family) [Hypnocyclicus thermotrophus]
MELVKITDFMEEKLIKLDLDLEDKKEALNKFSEILSFSENIIDKEKCYKDLNEREMLGTTGIGKGVAIPHAKTKAATRLTIAFVSAKTPIEYESLDGEKVKLFFIFASPSSESKVYLKILARISRLIREEVFRNKLINAKTPKEILELIDKEEKI